MLAITNWRRSYALLVLATFAVVAAADFLFYGHPVGWSAALFTAVFLAILAARDTRFLTTAGGRVMLLAAIGLVVALIEQPTWLSVSYTLLCLGILALINSFGWENDAWEWVLRWGRLLRGGAVRLFVDNGIVIRWLVRRGVSPVAARRITAWGLPLLMASVFVAIFALANPVISQWLWDLCDWMDRLVQKILDLLSIPRMFFWLVFAVWAWMLLRARARARARGRRRGTTGAVASDAADVPTGLVIRSLVLFNLIFAVQNVLDVRYLWGGIPLPPGMTYKEYVHRGFYPLIAAAILAGAFVLITFRPGGTAEKSPWARRLVYGWIAQTIFLSISAAWRLERYVGMSELTRWRVASVIWMLLVAAGLGLVIWRIVSARSNTWLINANAITAAVVLYACCFVNFDGMISHFNIRHCEEAGGVGSPLDIEYFRELGPTALADLELIRARIPSDWRRQQAAKVAADLRDELSGEMSDWRGWTIRRYQAARALSPDMAVASSAVAHAAPIKAGG